MLKVGITGGIGAGKTTVAKIIEKHGYPVYYADEQAKILMNTSPDIRGKIIDIFGDAAYTNQSLNKEFVAQKLFANKDLKQKMDQLVHPAVRAHFLQWVKQHTTTLLFQESALLFETGSYQLFDFSIIVTAPLHLRIERVMERNALSKEEVEKRIANQWPEEKKKALADFTIENITLETLPSQVEQILTILLQKEKSKQ